MSTKENVYKNEFVKNLSLAFASQLFWIVAF